MVDETTSKDEAPRPGSAKARLEAFDRAQKGKRLWTGRLIIAVVLLGLVLLIQMIMSNLGDDRSWFDVPKNLAFHLREGHWDELRRSLAPDFELVTQGEFGTLDAAALTKLAESRRVDEGLDVFTTVPHAFGRNGDRRWIVFWVTYSRGNLAKEMTIPLVQTWLVQAEMEREDDRWIVKRAKVRDTVAGMGALLGTSGAELPEDTKLPR